MGSSTQLYNLGWNDFDSSLRLAVKGLRSRRDLVDVTLAAGGKTFPAHKLILSAASSLFLELLKITPCQHPVILLAGIGARELEQVLDFVYSGEVAVRPSELSALLQAAHVLEIKGLVQGSITAEKPEDQEKAEAALAASTEEGEKVSAASLAAATKTGLLDTVSMGSEPSTNRKKKKRRYSDCCDAPHDKWGKYDSDEDTSDSEGPTKEVQTNSIATQTVSSESSVSQTIQEVVKSNPSGSGDCGNKPHKQSVGTLTSVSMCPTPVLLTTGKLDQSTTVTGNQPPTSSELGRHMPLCIDESSIIPPHHLEMNEDAENKEDSYADIAAAADAAALAASTLADKKGISEQPAACPLCNAIIRQSRNLRRHLELKHFGKRPKKGKGGKRKTRSSQCDTDTESNAGSVADTTVIEHVQVEMKSPCDAVLSSVPASASSSPTQTPPPKHHTLTELQPAHQHHNVEAYLHQQQLQQLDSFHHMAPPSSNSTYQIPYPHPHPHLSMLRGDPHVSILQEFRNHQQFSTSYSGSTRSSNHQ